MTGDLDLGSQAIVNVNNIQFLTSPTYVHSEGSIHWDDDDKTLNLDTEVTDTSIQVGQEQVLRATNKTGSLILNGKVVCVNGAQGNRPTIDLADADSGITSDTVVGVVTSDIADNATGYVTTFGLVRGLDTTGTAEGEAWSEGDLLYLSSTAGGFTKVKPLSPAHLVKVAIVIRVNAADGIILANIDLGDMISDLHDLLLTALSDGDHLRYETSSSLWKNYNDSAIDHDLISNSGTHSHADLDTLQTEYTGVVVETIDVDIDASGATIELTLQGLGGTDLTVVTAAGFMTVDTTPAASVTLTAGTSTVPQLNHVYLNSSFVLTTSTTGWPSAAHAPIATVLCLDRATTDTNGALKVHAYTDHLANGDTGHLIHIGKRIRAQAALWNSGVAITTIPALSATGSTISVSNTVGEIFQMHPHAFPVFDGAVDGHNIVNHNTTPFMETTDLGTQLTDSEGVSLSNKHYSLVVWGVTSEKSSDCHLMVNLPSGGYNTEDAADRDADKFANYSIPSQFTGVGFLIARLVVRNVGANFTMNVIEDLRGKIPSTSAGGGAGVTSHLNLSDIGTNTHTQIDTHIADTGDDHVQYLPIDGSRGMTGILESLPGTAALPSLHFGDTGTGLWGPSSSSLAFSFVGVQRYTFDSSGFDVGPGRPKLLNVVASATAPNLLPVASDIDTGVGRDGSDELVLISGGVTAIKLAESAGNIIATLPTVGTQLIVGATSTTTPYDICVPDGGRIGGDVNSNTNVKFIGNSLLLTSGQVTQITAGGLIVLFDDELNRSGGTGAIGLGFNPDSLTTLDPYSITFSQNYKDGVGMYNTDVADETNYEIGSLGWSSNVYTLKTEAGGTGTSRNILIEAPKLTVDGNLSVSGKTYQDGVTIVTPTGTTGTIDWDNGNVSFIDLGSATGNVTLTLSSPGLGGLYVVRVLQGATARNIIWPATVKWPGGTAPTISTGADDIDVITLLWDGSSYCGDFKQDYS